MATQEDLDGLVGPRVGVHDGLDSMYGSDPSNSGQTHQVQVRGILLGSIQRLKYQPILFFAFNESHGERITNIQRCRLLRGNWTVCDQLLSMYAFRPISPA